MGAMTLEQVHQITLILKDLWPVFVFLAMLIVRRWGGAAQYERTIRTAIELAGVLVADTERTVRDLKDPTKPGQWDDAARTAVKTAVLQRLRASLGPGLATLEQELRARGTTPDDLLDRIVEGQLEKLRTPPESA